MKVFKTGDVDLAYASGAASDQDGAIGSGPAGSGGQRNPTGNYRQVVTVQPVSGNIRPGDGLSGIQEKHEYPACRK
jgi:hypothetical protein